LLTLGDLLEHRKGFTFLGLARFKEAGMISAAKGQELA
jgi:hypothetical protein